MEWKTKTITYPTVALTFDDVQIIPRYSEVESRQSVNLVTQFTKKRKLEIPLIAAPMDTVCDYKMAQVMWDLGGVGVIHRFMPIEQQVEHVIKVKKYIQSKLLDGVGGPAVHHTELKANAVICAAIGANGDAEERALALLQAGVNVILIDVAHGHHVNVKRIVKVLTAWKDQFDFEIVAGSIATREAALDLVEWGADALRVGIGGGSVCETRIRTGVGIPQLHALIEVNSALLSLSDENDVPFISDGGIRYPGDVAKALSVGAQTVMIGSLFAGTDEAPGEVFIAGTWPNNKRMKMYRGSASASAKMSQGGQVMHVEGASKLIESKGPVRIVVNDILDGLRSCMSYVGVSNIDDFYLNSEILQITPSGLIEAHPHLLR